MGLTRRLVSETLNNMADNTVKIPLSKEDIEIVLKKCGYVQESVLGWYSPSYVSFEQAIKEYENGGQDVLFSAKVTVAYKEGCRPQILEYKYADITSLTPYKIENVLSVLINQTLKKIVIDSM